MAKRKRTIKPDLSEETMLLAEEDLAAMRPALAVAPELVVQVLSRQRRLKRKAAKSSRARKASAKKPSAKTARKAAPRKKKAARARKK